MKLVMFLLVIGGGAIINVAVAWGCALWIDPVKELLVPDAARGMRYLADDLLWDAHYNQTTARATFFSNFKRSPRGSFDRERNEEYGPDPSTFIPISTGMHAPIADLRRENLWQDCRCVEASGWPTLSMWHLRYHFNDWGDNKSSGGGIALSKLSWTVYSGSHRTPTQIPRVLPLRLFWPGFAINTIFYAAILYALFAVPAAVRRRLRHKSGQCAACGYSLRGTPHGEKCPECGASA